MLTFILWIFNKQILYFFIGKQFLFISNLTLIETVPIIKSIPIIKIAPIIGTVPIIETGTI